MTEIYNHLVKLDTRSVLKIVNVKIISSKDYSIIETGYREYTLYTPPFITNIVLKRMLLYIAMISTGFYSPIPLGVYGQGGTIDKCEFNGDSVISINLEKPPPRNPHLGVMIHWGVYTIPAFVPQHAPAGGSEWYLKRLGNTVSQSNKTREYHSKHFQDAEYRIFIDMFNETSKYANIPDWFRQFSLGGADYVIFTAKHHDGVSMYPSSVPGTLCTSFDFLEKISMECKTHNMKFGVYYSLLEWTEVFNNKSESKMKKYIKNILHPQIKEIVEKYRPEILWFDGDQTNTSEEWGMYALLDWLFLESPVKDVIVVNDRLGKGFIAKEHYRIRYDFVDKYTPDGLETVPYECIYPLSSSWGNAENSKVEITNSNTLVKTYEKIDQNIGGVIRNTMLLNFGPNKYGVLDSRELRVYRDFAKRIKNTGYYSLGLVGSRHFTDFKMFENTVDSLTSEIGMPTRIVSGGAPGADKLAERYASLHNLDMIIHKSEWSKHGQGAGPMRNTLIVRDSDRLIAFRASDSVGTNDTIKKAIAAKKPVKIIEV